MSAENTVEDCIGRTRSSEERLSVQPARFLQATLDQQPSFQEGDPLPPLWHWLYFLEAAQHSDLGRDSHPRKGGFLPPVSLPRRMWAGGRFQFHKQLRIGRHARKQSTITSIQEKSGRTGPLCFVTVEHQIFQENQLVLTEEHDIVYRDDPDPQAPQPALQPAPEQRDIYRTIEPSPVLLFRYSALTFNGHRIHYDADYARTVEGYEGLVFHGPLTATLLVNLASEMMKRPPKRFAFKGLAPIEGLHPFQIAGRMDGGAVSLWAERHDGVMAMTADAQF